MPLQQANLTAGLFQIWMARPSDGSTPLVFIKQDSAIAYQDAHPNDDVVATMGLSVYNMYQQNITDMYVLGDADYPISGDQAYDPDNPR